MRTKRSELWRASLEKRETERERGKSERRRQRRKKKEKNSPLNSCSLLSFSSLLQKKKRPLRRGTVLDSSNSFACPSACTCASCSLSRSPWRLGTTRIGAGGGRIGERNKEKEEEQEQSKARLISREAKFATLDRSLRRLLCPVLVKAG